MAFATKYKTEIQSWDGVTVSAEIQFDGSTATVESFTAIGSNPITIEHQANTNVKESYIIPSKAMVSFYVNDEWDCHELLYSNDRNIRLRILSGTTVIFIGFVISAISTEAYTTGQYVIRIQAVDSLSDLKNVPYLNSGALYNTFKTPATIIAECLANTGLSLSFWENIDIYAAAGMTTTATTHSPLNQSYIHTSAYGDTVEDVMSCHEVLEKILQAFHCRLYQSSAIDDTITWVISKINKLDTTSTYRKWSSDGSMITTNTSYAPLQTLSTAPTEPHHVSGPAQIAIQQGYKDIDMTAMRLTWRSLLNGYNFNSDDFNGSGVLTNWTNASSQWTNLSRTAWAVGGVGGYSESSLYGTTSLLLQNNDTRSFVSISSITSTGGTATVVTSSAHGRTNGDTITIYGAENDNGVSFDGQWPSITVTNTTTFTFSCSITGTGSTGVVYYFSGIQMMDIRLRYGGETSELQDVESLKITIRARSTSENGLYPFGLYANLGTGASDDAYFYSKLRQGWNVGDIGGATTGALMLTTGWSTTDFSEQTFEVNMENMTPTSAELYFGIGEGCQGPDGPRGNLNIDTITIAAINNAGEKLSTTTIDSNYVESKELDFFHADGDGTDNEEWIFKTPIYDDATPKLIINSWQQAGATADNLEDIIQANLATAYSTNSQIWSGTIKGDINISHSIKDPLNLDRIFQIQRISKNLENNFNSLSMIEIEPAEAYYVELMSGDTGVDAYYLSSEYGDISADFASGTIFISNMRRKSDGALVESGNEVRTLDGAATFTGGRVKIIVSDMAYTIDPLTGLEVKGVLRKI